MMQRGALSSVIYTHRKICQASGAMYCIAVALSNCLYALDLCHRRRVVSKTRIHRVYQIVL